MNFSINLNKIALLRDSRGSDNPSIKDYALQSIDLGVDGLTLHPRPDLRHAKPSDISMFDEICLKANKEFNIEGNLDCCDDKVLFDTNQNVCCSDGTMRPIGEQCPIIRQYKYKKGQGMVRKGRR